MGKYVTKSGTPEIHNNDGTLYNKNGPPKFCKNLFRINYIKTC